MESHDSRLHLLLGYYAVFDEDHDQSRYDRVVSIDHLDNPMIRREPVLLFQNTLNYKNIYEPLDGCSILLKARYRCPWPPLQFLQILPELLRGYRRGVGLFS